MNEELHKKLGSEIHEDLKKVLLSFFKKYKNKYHDCHILTAILGSLQTYFQLYAEHFMQVAPEKDKARYHVYKNLIRLEFFLKSIPFKEETKINDIEMTREEVVDMFFNHPSVPDCYKKLIASDPTMQDRAYEFAKYVINLHKEKD